MKHLNDLIYRAVESKIIAKVAVVAANDKFALRAIDKAIKLGLLAPIFFGEKDKILKLAHEENIDISAIEIINAKSPIDSARKAIELIYEGKADLLMKGLISTKNLMQVVLLKHRGSINHKTLSHLALFESPYYHKLIGLTDAAINVNPNNDERLAILKNSVEAYEKLDIKNPKIALIAPIEKINSKIPSTIIASELVEMYNKKPQFKCILQGPLALDLAVSDIAAKHKEIKGEVAGNADLLMVMEITAGNVIYKTLTCLGGAKAAGVVLGARTPIVLTSRADTEENKLLSIALAMNLL